MAEVPDDVRELISEKLGDDGVEILDQLAELGEATDTELSELLDKRTSQIRKALYGMYEERVADYEENRDPSNGWLTFVWQITPEQAMRSMEEARAKAAEEIRKEIAYEREKDFYACPNACARLPFEEAMDFEFACPDCGNQLEHEEPEARIEELNDQLQSLEKGMA